MTGPVETLRHVYFLDTHVDHLCMLRSRLTYLTKIVVDEAFITFHLKLLTL
jgi:hypothetical protein